MSDRDRVAALVAANPAHPLGPVCVALADQVEQLRSNPPDLAALRLAHEVVSGMLTEANREIDRLRAELEALRGAHRAVCAERQALLARRPVGVEE